METGGENLIGITRGKRETRIGIIIMAIPIVNETTDVQGAVVVRKGTLPENLIGELGVGHQLIPTLVILDMMPHCIQSPSL